MDITNDLEVPQILFNYQSPTGKQKYVPKMSRHASGQAVVRLSGKDHYLGKHGSSEAQERYDRAIAEWLGANRNQDFQPLANNDVAAGKSERAISPRKLARRYGVSIEKVLGWIRRGELRAINVAARIGHRPQWAILSQDILDFENRRAAKPVPPKQKPRRTAYLAEPTNYFPDDGSVVCVQCGTQMPDHKKMYCSKRCRREFWEKNHADYDTRRCAHCGENSHKRMYCSNKCKCAAWQAAHPEKHRERNRIYQQRQYQLKAMNDLRTILEKGIENERLNSPNAGNH